MPIQNSKMLTIRPFGVCDAVDGTNAPKGAMSILSDLIPNPSTRNQFVCRPASVLASSFSGFITPGVPNALLVVGNIAYGFVPSGRNAGKDEVFAYNLSTGVFQTIANITAANSPTSPATTGDWTPPTMYAVTASRIVITHPGYNFAGGYAIGWLDISSFTSNTVTGATHSNMTIDGLSSDVITVNGWQVGMAISGAGLNPGTYITSINAAGTTITISQNATATASGVTFTVTGGTPGAPLYGAGQTSPIALVGLPQSVSAFNERAYYAVANALVLSDVLLPTQVSGAGGTFDPVLFLGDNESITALAPLGLTNQVTGGIAQALIAFKGDAALYQVTGDPATTNLNVALNPSPTGCLAQNAVCNIPTGLAFIAPDGLRVLSLAGVVGDPIGANGEGVNVPFLYAVNPTRMCMAYNQNVLRVSLQNGNAEGQPLQEYWYHITLKSWTGPHSFPAAVISAYQGQPDHGFVAAGSGVSGKLFTSTVTPTANSTYTENGNAMVFTAKSILLPDNEEGSMYSVVESTAALSIPFGSTFNVIATNEVGDILNQLVIVNGAAANTIWDAFNWGAADWGGATPPFMEWPVPWTEPLVFKQMQVLFNGSSMAGVIIGNVYTRYEVLGYIWGFPV